MSTRRSHPLVALLALVGVVVLGFVGVSYALGWIEFHDSHERTTIEFDKKEASRDAGAAVEQTRELIKGTGRALKEAGEAALSDNEQPGGEHPLTDVADELAERGE